MQDLILISIPETTIKNIVEQAVKKALTEYDSINAAHNTKSVFSFLEGCAYIGISKSHGYRLTSSGQIPHSKRGKRIYFDKAELDEWLLANKVKSNLQISSEASNYIKGKSRKR